MRPGRPFRTNTIGASTPFDAGSETDAVMLGARLAATTAVASAVIREKDGSGAIVAELSAPINGSDEFRIPVAFRKALHVTLAGAGSSCIVYV